MRFLEGNEEKEALEFLASAAEEAKKATCLRARCGSVLVKDGEIIGRGFNSPPGDLESQRRCRLSKDSYDDKITDKTCCIHSEQRAGADALRSNPDKILGSRLYFTRVDGNGNPVFSGDPYCTICSKSILDFGVAEFVLHHEEGVCVYSTEEYNIRSFEYKG